MSIAFHIIMPDNNMLFSENADKLIEILICDFAAAHGVKIRTELSPQTSSLIPSPTEKGQGEASTPKLKLSMVSHFNDDWKNNKCKQRGAYQAANNNNSKRLLSF